MDSGDQSLLEESMRELLKSIDVIDEEVLDNTPERWSRALTKFCDKHEYDGLKKFDFKAGDFNQVVLVETDYLSYCEHHLLPFTGKVWIAYIPFDKIIGLSKIVKLAKKMFGKPTVQEKAIQEIADEFLKVGYKDVMVLATGSHSCCEMRYGKSKMVNCVVRGVFALNPYAKQEVLELIKIGDMK